MRLQRIRGERGPIRVERNIAPVTLIVGPNESGKTTTLELVDFALRGGSQRPRVPTDTAVDLKFDSLSVSRSIRYGGPDGRIHDLAVTGFGGVRPTRIQDREALILGQVGATWSWSAAELFAATPTERRKRITRLLGAGIAVDDVRQALTAANAGSTAFPKAAQAHLAREKDKLRKIEDGSEFADEWLAICRRVKNALQADAETARAAVATAAARVEAAGALPGSRAAFEAEVATARERVLEVERTIASANAHAASRRSLEVAAATARERYLAAKATAEADLTFYEKEVVEAERGLAEATTRADAAAETLRARHDDKVRTAEAFRTGTAQANEANLLEVARVHARKRYEDAAAPARAALRELVERHETERLRAGAARRLAEDLQPVVEYVLNAYKSSEAGPERSRLRDVTTHAATLAMLLERPDVEPPSLAQARAVVAKIDASESIIEAIAADPDVIAATAAEAEAKARASTLFETSQAAVRLYDAAREALALAQAQVGIARVTLANAQRMLDERRTKKAEAAATLPALAEASERAVAAVTDVPAADATANAAALVGAKDALRSAEATLRSILDFEAITADRDRCVETATAAAEARTELHHLERRAEQAVAELYRRAMDPLMRPASEITSAVFGRDVVVLPSEDWTIALRAVMADGSVDDVPIEHCSESTTVVVGIALHAALMAALPGWRAVIVDGLELVEVGRRIPLIAALRRFNVDNVLLACVTDPADTWYRDLADDDEIDVWTMLRPELALVEED